MGPKSTLESSSVEEKVAEMVYPHPIGLPALEALSGQRATREGDNSEALLEVTL